MVLFIFIFLILEREGGFFMLIWTFENRHPSYHGMLPI